MKKATRPVINFLKVELYKALVSSDIIHITENNILLQLATEPEIREYLSEKQKEDVEP